MAETVVIDALQYSKWDRARFEELRRGGLDAVHVTLVYWENARETITIIGRWHDTFRRFSDLILPVRSGESVSVDLATRNSGNLARPLSLLDSRWELSPESKLGTFNLRGYKPTYALPFFGTTKQNTTPHSPAPDHTVTTPQDLQSVEAKFQISLKTKVAENLFDDNGLAAEASVRGTSSRLLS